LATEVNSKENQVLSASERSGANKTSVENIQPTVSNLITLFMKYESGIQQSVHAFRVHNLTPVAFDR
jgi:hypothetical protein